jgi:transposase
MPRPYSEDLRLRVVNAVESGQTTRAVSALFQVSSSFVSTFIRAGAKPALFNRSRSAVTGERCWSSMRLR